VPLHLSKGADHGPLPSFAAGSGRGLVGRKPLKKVGDFLVTPLSLPYQTKNLRRQKRPGQSLFSILFSKSETPET